MELKELLKSEKLIIMACDEYPGFPDVLSFWGGMGVVVQSISERLVKRGFQVLVLPRRKTEYAGRGIFFEMFNGVHILSVPIKSHEGGEENADLYQIYPNREATIALDHSFTTLNYLSQFDLHNPIFHLHDWLSVAAARFAKNKGFRSIFTVHMSSSRTDEDLRVDKRLELERLAGSYANKIHYVSLAQMKSCQFHPWNSSKEHIIIQNGVDPYKYLPPETVPSEEYILFVGRLTPVKNVPNLVKAWAIFNEKYPKVGLKILGASGMSNFDVTNVVEELKQSQKKKVELRIEMVPESERIKYHQNCSVGCYPSSEEAFGLVAVETQSCEKPVIVGNVGGFLENVLEGVTGVHVNGFDPQSIAEGLILAYQNRKVWGRNARKLVELYFNWDLIVEQYIKELYN